MQEYHEFEDSPGPKLKTKRKQQPNDPKKPWNIVQVVELLLSMFKVLGSISTNTKQSQMKRRDNIRFFHLLN
jgi:hypothetical protein